MIDRTSLSLFALRVSVAGVMTAWTLDKFLRVEHAKAVFAKFYMLPTIQTQLMYAIGGAQALVVLMFVLGFKKRFSYGAILALHTVSTVASYPKYLDPYEGGNLLFFAAWPMWAACLTLYLLRDQDRFISLS